MSDKLLTVCGATYGHSINQLRVFCSSLLNQTANYWKAIIIHDGPELSPGFIQAREEYKEYENIQFIHSNQRFNDYGHSLRAWALNELVDTPYLHWENCDNSIFPVFVQWMMDRAVRDELDLIYCDILHNYHSVMGDGRLGYNVLTTYLHLNRIDFAAFCVKTSVAKEIGFNDRSTGADGIFISELMGWRPQTKVDKIHAVLALHN